MLVIFLKVIFLSLLVELVGWVVEESDLFMFFYVIAPFLYQPFEVLAVFLLKI